jgi:hypothetical protein
MRGAPPAAEAATPALPAAADAAAPRHRPLALAAAPHAQARIEAIDLARGVAVCLMILSHGVNGLLSFEQFTPWGLVPIHAITKIASSLFIIVFGIALGVAFVPHTQSPDWPRRRLKLLLNGLIVLFWYKLLTIVEMLHLHEPAQIVDALLYRAFPSYVEILGFYAIALLWLPFVLPLWARAPLAARLAAPLLLALLSWHGNEAAGQAPRHPGRSGRAALRPRRPPGRVHARLPAVSCPIGPRMKLRLACRRAVRCPLRRQELPGLARRR